jgi:adenylate cyclase
MQSSWRRTFRPAGRQCAQGRQSGPHYRQLADAQNGSELWGQTFDRQLRDIFATQDNIVERILSTLRLELSLSGSGLPTIPTALKHGTENIEAYDYYLRGFAPHWTLTKAGIAKSREMFERALAADPKYVGAVGMLCFTYIMEVQNGYSDDPARDLQRASELAQKALALDDNVSGPYMLLCQVNLMRGSEARHIMMPDGFMHWQGIMPTAALRSIQVTLLVT